MWNTSNPVLANDDKFAEFYGQDAVVPRANVATVQGVVNKTGILALVALALGGVGYWFVSQNPGLMWISWLASAAITFGIFFVIFGKPLLAVYLAPVYAAVEGFFLGGFTYVAEYILAQRGIQVAGGVALQALIITGCCVAAMLTLYSLRILRPTKFFVAAVSTATLAIALAYLVNFVMSLLGYPLPFLGLSATTATGTAGWIGVGVNLFILAIASAFLIIDFKTVEDIVERGSPKTMEWFAAFGLIVTIAWIYLEAVKLIIRLSSLLKRD